MSQSDSEIHVIKTDSDLEKAIKAVSSFSGGPFVVEIKPYEEKRSSLQNRWYFEIISQICDATGFDKEALHIWLKAKFLGLDPKTIWGSPINVTKSTTKLKVKEMSAYISEVERFCAEQKIELIYPNYWEQVHK